MELPSFIPSFEDFKNLATESNFSKDDIELQSKIASQVGYDDFHSYLQFKYYVYFNLFNIEELVKEFSLEYDIKRRIKGNLESKLLKYKDQSFEDELEPIYNRVQQLPLDIRSRVIKFEVQLRFLFIKSLLDNIGEDESLINMIKSILYDLANQFSLLHSEEKQSVLNIISYLEGISFQNTNKLITDSNSNNYYFNKQASILKQLHIELVIGKYIEQNENFENLFKEKIKPRHLRSIIWKDETPKLFYLLLRLNNYNEYIDGQRIDSIAHQLFSFDPEKTSDNLRTAFNKFISNIKDDLYIEKKMINLKQILDRILIK
jgi:hypothetical protein